MLSNVEPLHAAFFVPMSKNKKQKQKQQARQAKKKNAKKKDREGKKYVAGQREIWPTYLYDILFGQLEEQDFEKLEEAVHTNLNLIRIGSWDSTCYGNLLYAMRQFYAFAKRFEGEKDYEQLATMGTAALHGLKGLADNARDGHPSKPGYANALLEPLELAVDTYFTMMRALPRSEQEAARREAKKFSITELLQRISFGNIAIVAPNKTTEDESVCGYQGVAFVHGRCEPGYLTRSDDTSFWHLADRDTIIRIDRPTLMYLTEDLPHPITEESQENA